MIDRKALLDDLKKLVTKLEKDLRERCEESAEVDARVRIEYEKAKEAKRTAQPYNVWRDEWITQVAVAWVLGIVFVRFIEDNGLIAAPFIAGPGERLQFAKEQRTAFFQQNPTQSDREYLEHVFREVAKLPAMRELYDERHNPLWALGVSGDGAKLILEQFQKIDPETGTLVHDFTDREWNTRFLGDLYQDLSEAARKKYALLQTPEFVEEFILDRTLDPAVAEFGLSAVRMIDPTCGSGHFLLGSFARLFRLWEEREPATNLTMLAQRALDSVYGVDLNPYATAISRFRLLLAAMNASGVKRLMDAPDFRINLATGDSLLHGPRFSATAGVQAELDAADDPLRHVYTTEDRDDLRRILGQQYHAVVGNPPYITVKDKALNDAYRQRYGSCYRQYSLSVPFMERFFDLTLPTAREQASGFVGQITSNSFMKREFGSKLIESFMPRWDLTHMIDTSGAYIPGHGTPTVILFGRNQIPQSDRVRAVLGIRGEPSTPENPAKGRVWAAILSQIDQPGSKNEWVSVADAARTAYHKHPWSIGGGGAAELKELLDGRCSTTLDAVASVIGFMAVTREDDAYMLPLEAARRHQIPDGEMCELISGEDIRDWVVSVEAGALWPYRRDTLEPSASTGTLRLLWPLKRVLSERVAYGSTQIQRGLRWFEYSMFFGDRYGTPSIAYAEVASHNHFVLDRGGKVFKQTAPIIKLPPKMTEDDHLALLGLLNSSTACFWMKQVSHQKQMMGGDGIRVNSKAKVPYQFGGTQLGKLPIPSAAMDGQLRDRLTVLTRQLRHAAEQYSTLTAERVVIAIDKGAITCDEAHRLWRAHSEERSRHFSRMIVLQEEIDFLVYEMFGLSSPGLLSDEEVVVPLLPGARPFEILRGGNEDGFTVAPDVPGSWPSAVRELWRRRIEAIRVSESMSLIEDPVYKRRWIGRQGLFNWNRQRDELAEACAHHLAGSLERSLSVSSQIVSAAVASESLRRDRAAMQVAALYRGSDDFDVDSLVDELVAADSVPMLPTDRYKESGLHNRAAWEETWELQRREDRGEEVDGIPVPPKYKSSDFRSQVSWSLRGKLDVPKERFISFPGCEREADPSLPILWAGYDHLQQARAIAAYYQDLKDNEAAAAAKLGKLLACMLDLLPWLKQWHNDVDPEYGTRLGDFFESFMHAEMAGLGLTMDDLRKIRGL